MKLQTRLVGLNGDQTSRVELYLELKARILALLTPADRPQALNEVNGERFLKRSSTEQDFLLERLEEYYLILAEPLAFRRSPNQDFIRAALKRLGWKVSSRTLAKIGELDTAEIYGVDMKLRAANMRFMQLCSYSLEEILENPFNALFERDAGVTTQLLDAAAQIANGRKDLVTDLGDVHFVNEISSLRQRRFAARSNFVSAIYTKSNSLAGYLYSCTATILEK